MPRYFFHMTGSQTYQDGEGSELPDLETARGEALRTLGDMLKSRDAWRSNEWQIDITDAAEQSLLKLTFSLSETRAEVA